MANISLFPPVLDLRGQSISQTASTFSIFFVLPSTVSWNDFQHFQLVIKNKTTGQYAVNKECCPDGATIFIPKSNENYYDFDSINNFCELIIPKNAFNGESQQIDTTYIIQIRFGKNKLWKNPTKTGTQADKQADPLNDANNDFTLFETWRQEQISSVPSKFGEWSNIQYLYCHGDYDLTLSANINNFIPQIILNYSSEYKDMIESCKIAYNYQDIYGLINKKSFNQSLKVRQDGSQYFDINLSIVSLYNAISISVQLVTINNTVIGQTEIIPALASFPLYKTNLLEFKDYELQAEENDDGVIAKEFISEQISPTEIEFRVYRINLLTCQGIKINSIRYPENTSLTNIKIKDYSVQMGENYLYVGTIYYADVHKLLTRIYPNAEHESYDDNGGFGRIMRMDSIYLDDKFHQLRIQGNVSLSGFKRTTSDSFQTTLGSKYPYYNRSANTNYRTFSLSGVISINFDATAAFLNLDTYGLYWKNDQNDSRVIVLNQDLFEQNQFTLSRLRKISDANKIIPSNEQIPSQNYAALSRYSDYLYSNKRPIIDGSISNQNILVERKFRDYVMNWLSDGKPKLFRSETQGNMIVMISGASFSPLDKTSRMIYSVSMTITQIADYNTDELLKYNLLPCQITSNIISVIPREIMPGQKISLEVFRTLKEIDPLHTVTAYFFISGQEYETTSAGATYWNPILKNITKYTFTAGDEDESLPESSSSF